MYNPIAKQNTGIFSLSIYKLPSIDFIPSPPTSHLWEARMQTFLLAMGT